MVICENEMSSCETSERDQSLGSAVCECRPADWRPMIHHHWFHHQRKDTVPGIDNQLLPACAGPQEGLAESQSNDCSGSAESQASYAEKVLAPEMGATSRNQRGPATMTTERRRVWHGHQPLAPSPQGPAGGLVGPARSHRR